MLILFVEHVTHFKAHAKRYFLYILRIGEFYVYVVVRTQYVIRVGIAPHAFTNIQI